LNFPISLRGFAAPHYFQPFRSPFYSPWTNTLKKAGLPFSRSITCASAGVSPLTIAQMLGHSSAQIIPRYAQVLDQNRLDEMKKLVELKKSTSQEIASATADETVPGNAAVELFDSTRGFSQTQMATRN